MKALLLFLSSRYCRYFCVISIVSLCACSKSNIRNTQETVFLDSDSSSLAATHSFLSSKDSLSLPEYRKWLLQQRGIAHDAQGSKNVDLSITYHPATFEAALDRRVKSTEDWEKVWFDKKDYHFFYIAYSEKITATLRGVKEELLEESLRSNLIIVTGEGDTLTHFFTEFFPSRLVDEPNRLIAMVPQNMTDKSLSACVRGKDYGVKDIQLSISESQLNSFPKIKI